MVITNKMQPRRISSNGGYRKTRILELFAHLCGWMWIGVACASIYFLYVALAGAAPWSNLLRSIGAGLIAKILAAVLNRNKLCSDSWHATESTSGGRWSYRIGSGATGKNGAVNE